MKVYKIVTPQNVEIEYTLAGLGSRGAAFMVDTILQWLVFLVLGGIAFGVLYASGFNTDSQYLGWVAFFVILAIFLIYFGYFVLFEQVYNGKTPGKKLFKIRVIRENGQSVTFFHSFIRSLMLIIDLMGIGPLLIWLQPKYKRLGDFLASTVVVVEKKMETKYFEISFQQEGVKKYQFTPKEEEMMKQYFARKDELYNNGREIAKEIAEYFSDKFQMEVKYGNYEFFLEEIWKDVL